MKAHGVLWTAPGQVALEDFDIDEPAAHEVLIENNYSLVSPGTEVEWLSSDEAHFIFGTTFPFRPGYAAAGTIVAVGSDVEGWKEGDRVITGYNNYGRPYGTHATHLLSLPGKLNRVPDNMPLEEAVFFNLGQTAVHVVELSGLRLSDEVAIVGQGPIGNLAVQVAKVAGAARVVALDLLPSRREEALRVGATDALDPTAEEAFTRFIDTTGGIGKVIDLSASKNGINTAVQIAAPLGTVVLSTGYAGRLEIDYGAAFVKGLHLVGAFVNARPERAAGDIETFLRLAATGAISVKDLLSQPYAPEEAPRVYQRLVSGNRSNAAPLFEWKKE